MSCYCDYERPEFYLSRIVKARAQHMCVECNNTIAIGTRYEYVSGKWDGHIDSFKTCLKCVALKDYTLSNVPCLCWSHGNLIEDCIETLKEYRHELPGLLFGGYRIIATNKKLLTRTHLV